MTEKTMSSYWREQIKSLNTARAMIHSTNSIGLVEILVKFNNQNKYIVRTDSGIECTAIYNHFTGLYYADDIYGKVTNDYVNTIKSREDY